MACVLWPVKNGSAGEQGANLRVVENSRLRVEFNTDTGEFSVSDKKSGCLWRQYPRPIEEKRAVVETKIVHAPAGMKIDGDLDEWKAAQPVVITSGMVADKKDVKDNRDCSAVCFFMWDEKNIYVAARVVDDKACMAQPGARQWWYKDSIEMWVGPKQVGFTLNPKGSQATTTSAAVPGAQVVVKLSPGVGSGAAMKAIAKQDGCDVKGCGGYIVEAAVPWKSLGRSPKAGARFPIAVGVNDADATGTREGQIYFPATWTHSRPETFATGILADKSGKAPAPPKQPELKKVRNVKVLGLFRKGIQFETELDIGGGKKAAATVKIELLGDKPDMRIEVAMPAETDIRRVNYPPGLAVEGADLQLCCAPYADGLLLPLKEPFPRKYMAAFSTLDMPWIGVTDLKKGYALIFETPDDGGVEVVPMSWKKKGRLVPRVWWVPTMKEFGYDRKVLYHFSASGGYVALAKRYREYAKSIGFLKTLREKRKLRPDIEKLIGAPDIWGADGLPFCRSAKAAGIDRMIVNGTWSKADTEAIKAMGYLNSVYDNYEDIWEGGPGRYGDCKTPDDAPLRADGKRQLGWPTWKRDPKTNKPILDPKTKRPIVIRQAYKRCSALDLPVAKRWIPKDQAKHPRNARFLDVTTATGLRECYDPKHRCTRTVDREYKMGLAKYVAEGLRLVLGGEHGRWWGAHIYDYWEGMQSGGFYSWPAGHVGMDIPQKREDIGENYMKYGIGHYYRIPLWELVFGDCVVSTWYWGDSTGHLREAAPELSYKKDCFNILYGTVPLYWVSKPYSFKWSDRELRARLLESYRNTCKVHEQTGYEEMLNHEFVTEDRAVQRTTFSSGITCTVNFGSKPYEIEDGGRKYVLEQYGFFVKGPAVTAYRAKVDGKLLNYIESGGYLFVNPGGKERDFGKVAVSVPTTVRVAGDSRLNIVVEGKDTRVKIRPGSICRDWDFDTTYLFVVNLKGERCDMLKWRRLDGGTVEFTASSPDGRYELVSGKSCMKPDPAIEAGGIALSKSDPRQGEAVEVRLALRNYGPVAAKRVTVSLFADARREDRLIASETVAVPAKGRTAVKMTLDTTAMDGPHELLFVVDPGGKVDELLELNNSAAVPIEVAVDHSRWPFKLPVSVSAGKTGRSDAVVALKVNLTDELKRMGKSGAVDKESVRVVACDKNGDPLNSVPAQFDPSDDFDAVKNAAGEVVWIVQGDLPANSTRRYRIYFDLAGKTKRLPPMGRVCDESGKTISAAGYTARIEEGCIVDLAARSEKGVGVPFLRSLVYSSGQTGWTVESNNGVEVKVKSCGPVRAVVRVKKKLDADVVYEKTYIFYPKRFDVDISVNKQLGLPSRAYYRVEGTFEDDKGNKAVVDGKGDGEGVIGKNGNPKWYVVYAPDWAQSCVALTKFTGLTYWDGGYWGGIGFSTSELKCRLSYVIHGGQKNAEFGRLDYERLTNPPVVKIAR